MLEPKTVKTVGAVRYRSVDFIVWSNCFQCRCPARLSPGSIFIIGSLARWLARSREQTQSDQREKARRFERKKIIYENSILSHRLRRGDMFSVGGVESSRSDGGLRRNSCTTQSSSLRRQTFKKLRIRARVPKEARYIDRATIQEFFQKFPDEDSALNDKWRLNRFRILMQEAETGKFRVCR